TEARAAPGRTRAGSARPPNSSPSAVTTMVLPAPVSPVSAVKPAESSSTASSMTPRPVIRTSSSMLACVLPGTAAPARHGQAELDPQPVREAPAAGARRLQPCEQDRQRPSADLHAGPGRPIDLTPTIAPQNRPRCLGRHDQLDRED